MIAKTNGPRRPTHQLNPKSKEPDPMNLHDPVHVLCALLGITPAELSVPCRILRIDRTEKNPIRIEEASRACFARVQSVQHHVPPEAAQWMTEVITHARSEMLRKTNRPSAPVPQAAETSYDTTPHSEPPVVVRTHVPRYSREFNLDSLTSAVGALAVCALLLLGVGWFIRQSGEDLLQHTKPKPSEGGLGLVVTEPVPKIVLPGGGKADSSKRPPVTTPPVKPKPSPMAGDAKAKLQEALTLARQGSFKEAQRIAERVQRQLPDESDGLSYIISYAEQYPNLADQARLALNGSSEVDLGPPFGKAQFVEQTAENIAFFSKGKHKTFTIKEFNGRKGVRFCVFRAYLDNASLPANDLIIGAYQFLLRVNELGEQDATSGVPDAKRRFRKAITNGNATTIEQGTLMLKALESLADNP